MSTWVLIYCGIELLTSSLWMNIKQIKQTLVDTQSFRGSELEPFAIFIWMIGY